MTAKHLAAPAAYTCARNITPASNASKTGARDITIGEPGDPEYQIHARTNEEIIDGAME